MRRLYSTDRLAAFTTLAHFAVSSARNLPNSPGDMGIGMPPRSASFAFIFGLASAAAIDLFRISTTSAGVPLGAEMPYQGAASKPGIVSAMAGMSGSPGQRCATVTPSACNWPLRTNSIEFVRSGQLRALGVTVAQRWPGLPDIPAIAETIPGFEAAPWYGISAPKGTPAEVVEILNKSIAAALANPKMKAKLADLGGIPITMSPAEFGNVLADDTAKWAKVVKAANLSVE